jgi:arylsulfatase A-like enzyme
VITTDFYPTLLQLAGLALFPEQHKDGISLVPLLEGRKLERNAPLFWHYPHFGNQGGAPYGAIRDGDWKLIEWFEDGSLVLYNVAHDPGEKQDLSREEPGKLRDLHAKMIAWRKEVNAVMPTPNPDFGKQSDGQKKKV